MPSSWTTDAEPSAAFTEESKVTKEPWIEDGNLLPNGSFEDEHPTKGPADAAGWLKQALGTPPYLGRLSSGRLGQPPYDGQWLFSIEGSQTASGLLLPEVNIAVTPNKRHRYRFAAKREQAAGDLPASLYMQIDGATGGPQFVHQLADAAILGVAPTQKWSRANLFDHCWGVVEEQFTPTTDELVVQFLVNNEALTVELFRDPSFELSPFRPATEGTNPWRAVGATRVNDAPFAHSGDYYALLTGRFDGTSDELIGDIGKAWTAGAISAGVEHEITFWVYPEVLGTSTAIFRLQWYDGVDIADIGVWDIATLTKGEWQQLSAKFTPSVEPQWIRWKAMATGGGFSQANWRLDDVELHVKTQVATWLVDHVYLAEALEAYTNPVTPTTTWS